jgi:UDPglucose 6-dehydrogenase
MFKTNMEKEKASISILGSGIVGLNVGKGFLKLGHKVVFYDVDRERVSELSSLGLNATNNIDLAIRSSQISFICVPTPTTRGKIDLTYIRLVVEQLGKSLEKKEAYHLVVIKSTILPTTIENFVIPILKQHSGKRLGENIGICSNPEFLTEIHNSWTDNKSFARDFFDEPFVVIGELDKNSGDMLSIIYKSLKVPIIRTNLRTAEMIKYAFNCALACKISYWNEIFYICRKLEVDSRIVASTAAMDNRIGKYGTIHGKAFGGKCLPKDLRAFIDFSQKLDYDAILLKAIEEINVRIGAEFGIRE